MTWQATSSQSHCERQLASSQRRLSILTTVRTGVGSFGKAGAGGVAAVVSESGEARHGDEGGSGGQGRAQRRGHGQQRALEWMSFWEARERWRLTLGARTRSSESRCSPATPSATPTTPPSPQTLRHPPPRWPCPVATALLACSQSKSGPPGLPRGGPPQAPTPQAGRAMQPSAIACTGRSSRIRCTSTAHPSTIPFPSSTRVRTE